jgi:uncharacterized membrane protein
MSSEHQKDCRDPRLLFSSVLLVLTLMGFAVCLFYAHPSPAFILASLIPAALAVVTHVYRLHRPSQPLDILVILWLILGIGVVKAWIPDVGSWETWLFYCFALALISASTVFVLVQQRRRLNDDVA